jgi:hypothetical protein
VGLGSKPTVALIDGAEHRNILKGVNKLSMKLILRFNPRGNSEAAINVSVRHWVSYS